MEQTEYTFYESFISKIFLAILMEGLRYFLTIWWRVLPVSDLEQWLPPPGPGGGVGVGGAT